jgi:tetratricopeptide (TPR) repeat protein
MLSSITECTAALRIHSRYMKAMLRRGRCYSRLDRYEEAIAEYKRWGLEMAQEARKTPHNIAAVLTPCLFDGPHDVSEADTAQVKQELGEVLKTKNKNDAAARAEANYCQQRQNKWQKDAQKASSDQGDAERRRDYFYSQKTNSRRWDSFTDRGPKRSGNTNPQSGYGAEKSKPKGKPPSKNSSNPDCHYNVLGIIKNGATESDIGAPLLDDGDNGDGNKSENALTPEVALKIARRVSDVAYQLLLEPERDMDNGHPTATPTTFQVISY